MSPDKRWSESESMVMSKLEQLEKCTNGLNESVVALRVDMARLSVKSGVWGIIGSALPVVAALIWYALKTGG